jgi:hypothetical protein
MAELILSKKCSKCGVEKTAADFYKNVKNKCGLHSWCKLCLSESTTKYRKDNQVAVKANNTKYYILNKEKAKEYGAQYYLNNSEKLKARNAEWVKNNPDKSNAYKAKYKASNLENIKENSAIYRTANIDKRRVYRIAYYAANFAKIRCSIAAWYAANPERSKANSAAWAKKNLESRRLHWHNRQAKKIESGGKLSKGLADKLLKSQKGKCICCGLPLGDDYHLDHKMPLALGGSNVDSNMQLLRRLCNLQKSSKHPIDFMQSRGFLL